MKTYSLAQLQALAEPEFDKHGVKEFHATADGQLFIKKHFAILHANGGEVYNLVKDGKPKGEKGPSIAQLTVTLEGINDKEELEKMLTAEAEGEDRKGAIAAIQLRILVLSLEEISDKDELAGMLEKENTAEKKNKDAIAAINGRIAKLSE